MLTADVQSKKNQIPTKRLVSTTQRNSRGEESIYEPPLLMHNRNARASHERTCRKTHWVTSTIKYSLKHDGNSHSPAFSETRDYTSSSSPVQPCFYLFDVQNPLTDFLSQCVKARAGHRDIGTCDKTHWATSTVKYPLKTHHGNTHLSVLSETVFFHTSSSTTVPNRNNGE